MLAPAPGSLRSMRPSAAAVTPSGSWRPPTLMAASSASTPMGRPSPESGDRLGPRFGDRLRLRQANFRELAEVAPGRGLRRRRWLLLRPRPVELPARRRGSRLRLPDRRAARHALRHEPRRPGIRAARRRSTRRADGPLPALRRGAVRRPDRPGDRRGPPQRPGRDGRGARRARRAGRPVARAGAPPHPSRRPASSRRSGSRSTRSSRRSRRALPPPSTCSGRVVASSS